MRWLGLDSSLTSFGFAAFETASPGYVKLLKWGAWKTEVDPGLPKIADKGERIAYLGRRLVELLDETGATAAYIESLAMGMPTSRLTTQTLGRVRGLVEGICLARGVALHEISAQATKKALCGAVSASKEDVRRRVAALYDERLKGAGLDATDAIAVGHAGVAKAQPPTLRFDWAKMIGTEDVE